MRPTTPQMIEQAMRYALEKPSTSYVQRKLMIGYNHACELMEHFEEQGLVTAKNPSGVRAVTAKGMAAAVHLAERI